MKDNDTTSEHKKHAPTSVDIVIMTVSSSRDIERDESGKIIEKEALLNGHRVVAYRVVADSKKAIQEGLLNLIENDKAQAIIINGGTGISKADITIEAIRPFFEKELASFNSLFSYLSFKDIGSAALLSRSTAGIYRNCIIFCIPGSPKACELAMKALIIPELGHILHHLDSDG